MYVFCLLIQMVLWECYQTPASQTTSAKKGEQWRSLSCVEVCQGKSVLFIRYEIIVNLLLQLHLKKNSFCFDLGVCGKLDMMCHCDAKCRQLSDAYSVIKITASSPLLFITGRLWGARTQDTLSMKRIKEALVLKALDLSNHNLNGVNLNLYNRIAQNWFKFLVELSPL